MTKKIYLIQPTYRDNEGRLLQGKNLYVVSLALPALSATIPAEWEKEFCYEYFEDINFDTDASVIGISSMGYEIFRGIEIAEEFRRRGKKVIFGGFQPHISRDYVRPHCDSIIHGNPGRADMAKILNDIESRCLQAEYYCRTDLNYRFDYSVLDTAKIFFAPVLLSVGCYNDCDYCCIGSIYRRHYSLRKIRYVLDELDELHRTTRRIAVVDTNVYNNPAYLRRLCREMINRKYNFIWGAQSTVDIGEDEETLGLLRRAGCRILFIGMETLEQQNLDGMHKHYSVESYAQKIRSIHSAGVKIAAFFMYGLDGDTFNTAAHLSRFIIDQRIALPMLNVLVPTPGTPLYERLKREDRILMKDEQEFLRNNPAYNSSFSLCFYRPRNMTPAEVEAGFIEVLKRLSRYWHIIRRSLSKDIPLSLFLLYMNYLFRKEYIVLRRHRKGVVAAAGCSGSAQICEVLQ
jgi:radical SAM superfamily enzyme YgiQ (UPF0313 family)